jgi:unsaturated rhamnogalacturonyl hydrolase
MKKLKQLAKAKYSVRMANSVLAKFPELTDKWQYDYGVVFKGFEYIYENTGNEEYFEYIKKNIDYFVQDDGSIKKYSPEEYNIDHINNGKAVLFLYRKTGEEKYRKAAQLLRSQLKTHPRTTEGGFWHKNIYPHQMWLDGIYMGSPFYAEYATLIGQDEAEDIFDDVAKQVILCAKNTKDPITGLHFHGWDESRQQKWANKITGCSPNFWGRAMGWFAMAIVDVLDFLPQDHQSRETILSIFKQLIDAILKYQDPETGVWYQVVNFIGRNGNYPEASASCMFAYALAKGIEKGYLDSSYIKALERAYEGIIYRFIEEDENGLLNLNGVCMVAGLGGNPYRDGSYEYYISEPIKTNDLKGIGAFLKASAWVERLFE